MESDNTQRKAIYPRIFYFGLEFNPQQSRHCENPRFFDAMFLWVAIPLVFSLEKKRVCFENGF